jgi:hypothetical protein
LNTGDNKLERNKTERRAPLVDFKVMKFIMTGTWINREALRIEKSS